LHGADAVEAASLISACFIFADNALGKGMRAMNLAPPDRPGFRPVMSA